MAGYTPVFSSIFDGTLHGKWPQTGVWLALLAMTDQHGCIDRTPQAIASDIGISAEELMLCIAEFCKPDPMSRTQECEGRRLVPIDPARTWGWRVVAHGRYRDKARKAAFDSARVADGRNADRMKTRRDPTRPAKTRPDPPSDSDSDSDSDKKSEVTDKPSGGVGEGASRTRAAEQRGSRIPTPFLVTAEMRKWASEKTPHVNLEAATEDFCNYWRALPGQRSRKLDWVLTWKNRMKECEDKAMRHTGNGKSKEPIDEILARQRREAEAEGEPL